MVDTLKNDFLESLINKYVNKKLGIVEVLAGFVKCEVLVPTAFYIDNKAITDPKELSEMNFSEDELERFESEFFVANTENDEQYLVVYTSNKKVDVVIPKHYNLVAMDFSELLDEYLEKKLDGIMINPGDDNGIILKNMHLELVMKAIEESIKSSLN